MAAFTVDMSKSAEATPATDQSEISLRSSPLLSGDAVTTEQLPVRSPHSARLTACCTAPPTGDRQTAVSGDGARGGNLHLSCAHCGIKPEYRGGKLTRLRQGAAPDCCPQTEVRGWPLFYFAWWPDKEINRGWNGAMRSDLQSVVFIIMLHQHYSELRSSPWPSFWNFSLICSLQHYSSLNHNSEITSCSLCLLTEFFNYMCCTCSWRWVSLIEIHIYNHIMRCARICVGNTVQFVGTPPVSLSTPPSATISPPLCFSLSLFHSLSLFLPPSLPL